MEKITLTAPQVESQILIQEGLFEKSGKLLKEKFPDNRVVIVTDSNLEKIFGKKLKKIFPRALFIAVPAGEESKGFDFVIKLIKKLLENGITKHDVLMGFGGGMVTDLAGFVASIYMRGIKYVTFPTSLIGMVDAAVGGKTGINFIAKNIVGTFYVPRYVLIDPLLLKNFPDPKKLPGMGEVIKYAATIDSSLFRDFEKEPFDLLTIIKKSVKAKVSVVSKDLKEKTLRLILNYGHTFGHAIESVTDYRLTHDQAISIGMVISNKIAQKLGKQKRETGEKIKAAIEKFGLPTALPKNVKLEDLVDLIRKDKKRRGNKIDFIIAPKLGSAEIVPLEPEELVKLAK